WTRQWRALFRPALIPAAITLLLVALPWYILVAVDTKAKFLQGFLLQHNVNRFLTPMETHDGSLLYYPIALWMGMAPWSVFWWLLGWPPYEWFRKRGKLQENADTPGVAAAPFVYAHAYKFLASWLLVVMVFFSLAATKLPNYILPASLPCALLAAHLLVRWCR